MSRIPFTSDKTPRDRDNVRHGDNPFAVQARMALDNLEAAANATGLSLEYVAEPFPVRTLTQSTLAGFDIEVDAVLARHLGSASGD